MQPSRQLAASETLEQPTLEPELAQIYRAQIRFVWDFLLYIGTPHADVEDVAHEVFLVVFRRLAHYDQRRPIRPWITGIAVRVAADYRRRAYRRREIVSAETTTGEADDHGDAEDQLVRRRKRTRLLQLMNGMPEKWRIALVLHDVEQYSAPEIAQMLGVPLNTIYSRVRRARKRMEKQLRRTTSEATS